MQNTTTKKKTHFPYGICMVLYKRHIWFTRRLNDMYTKYRWNHTQGVIFIPSKSHVYTWRHQFNTQVIRFTHRVGHILHSLSVKNISQQNRFNYVLPTKLGGKFALRSVVLYLPLLSVKINTPFFYWVVYASDFVLICLKSLLDWTLVPMQNKL